MEQLNVAMPRSERGRIVREQLAAAGVTMSGPQSGRMELEHGSASLELEADDVLRLRMDVATRIAASVALSRNLVLPGNVRFAWREAAWGLVGETRVNGAAHLPASLNEIGHGFARAIGPQGGAVIESDKKSDTHDLAQAIRDGGWSDEEAVEIDQGWELRPRLCGTAVPVEVVVAAEGLRVRRGVLANLPDGVAGDATCHQALAFNEQLRLVRLAIEGERIVVESRLHQGLVDADWLRTAVTAVASASRATSAPLRVLAEDAEVARCYAEMFLEE